MASEGPFGKGEKLTIVHTSRNLVAGQTPTIIIKDPAGVNVINDDAMSDVGDGFYEFKYNFNKRGTYKIRTKSPGRNIATSIIFLDDASPTTKLFRGGSSIATSRAPAFHRTEKIRLFNILEDLIKKIAELDAEVRNRPSDFGDIRDELKGLETGII